MKWYNSLLFKFSLIVLAAILFMPIAIPFASIITYVPTILLKSKDEQTPYKGYNELESMWHAEAKKLAGKTDEEIRGKLESLHETYRDSQVFWVDRTGKTRDTFSYKDKLPAEWSVPYTIQFMKDSVDADPFTVLAFLGEDPSAGFMVIKVDRIFLDPPIQRLSNGYNYLFVSFVCIIFILFILFSSLFFNNLRKRLIRLRNAMQNRQQSGIPLPIAISKYDEIGQLEESFNLMVNELGESREREKQEEKLRRELISNLSHDLRTPLTIIRGHLASMRQEALTARGKEALESIDQRIDFLSSLIENLLSYTLLSSGKYPFRPADTEINRFIRSSIASWYPALEQHGIEVVADITAEGFHWSIDRSWMERIIDNLLQNVIRHAGEGKYVKITVRKNQITIQDKGKGFSAESSQKGIGIGMVIVDVMVREMGLSLEVDSNSAGTSITIKKSS